MELAVRFLFCFGFFFLSLSPLFLCPWATAVLLPILCFCFLCYWSQKCIIQCQIVLLSTKIKHNEQQQQQSKQRWVWTRAKNKEKQQHMHTTIKLDVSVYADTSVSLWMYAWKLGARIKFPFFEINRYKRRTDRTKTECRVWYLCFAQPSQIFDLFFTLARTHNCITRVYAHTIRPGCWWSRKHTAVGAVCMYGSVPISRTAYIAHTTTYALNRACTVNFVQRERRWSSGGMNNNNKEQKRKKKQQQQQRRRRRRPETYFCVRSGRIAVRVNRL